MFLKVIACEIAHREICFAAARSRNLMDLEFLPQGHHDRPCVGRAHVQECIDAVPAGKFDAILIGYGLCSNILVGLTTQHTPLVIPRAHDCITFFLGSKEPRVTRLLPPLLTPPPAPPRVRGGVRTPSCVLNCVTLGNAIRSSSRRAPALTTTHRDGWSATNAKQVNGSMGQWVNGSIVGAVRPCQPPQVSQPTITGYRNTARSGRATCWR